MNLLSVVRFCGRQLQEAVVKARRAARTGDTCFQLETPMRYILEANAYLGEGFLARPPFGACLALLVAEIEDGPA